MISSKGMAIAGLISLLSPVTAWAQPSQAQPSQAEPSAAELAKKLANPISSLISVPFQNNYDCCFGPSDGYRYTLNVQPVVPISISQDWNLIVRTIVPIVYQQETAPGAGSHSGFSDVTQSFFFSPKASHNGVTWGVGPAMLYPLGDEELGSQKWGAGPTFVVLKQEGPMTLGLLANHIWSYAGHSDRSEVNQTFLQPFFNYTYPSSTGIIITTESSYNWKLQQWSVPIEFGVNHLYKFGNQRVQLAWIMKYYALTETEGPAWGARFQVTLLYPK